jgi:hypothetical protein
MARSVAQGQEEERNGVDSGSPTQIAPLHGELTTGTGMQGRNLGKGKTKPVSQWEKVHEAVTCTDLWAQIVIFILLSGTHGPNCQCLAA